MTRIRAQFDGKVLIPTEPVDLPTDRVFEIEVRDEEPPVGSPAAILKVMRSPPHVSPDIVDELERAIEDGRMPPTEGGIFNDLIAKEHLVR
jgi:hypothetical protein